ncbi:hypothetical protein [Nonomuraea soli]|uniref:Uncharacterized protein n=1 Tax=Nonomuraea soli TaxID=1032476 RepID=A0A7W0CUW7_9ACTN|nr:hypothetical protein [Nonomuraea soli]MBA2897799.1 hypothetical protein [Nonomuraea soli]
MALSLGCGVGQGVELMVAGPVGAIDDDLGDGSAAMAWWECG